MAKKQLKSRVFPAQRNPDIFRFIDFFVHAGEKILGVKPAVIRGKDGRLVSYALKRLPVAKLETLAVWFLAHKKNLKPLVGTMLSSRVLDELTREMNKSSFWKEIDQLMDTYYPRSPMPKMWQPFTHADITNMKEAIAKHMRNI
ncbi:MAG: hypothetical protein G01um101470_221 [Parcubacteria group bacterium Gr01-1014_70]|nr:MAG: hypothetical protein G01um101470_221 [Parcubacteria group bacterium Gr01-1014_70]